MAIFRYKVISRDGKLQQGVSDFVFSTHAAVAGYFERKGNEIVSLSRLPFILEGFYKVYFHLRHNRIKGEDIAEFLRSIAVMLKAGVPLFDAIDDASEYSHHPALGKIADDIKMSLESGIGLADSVSKYGSIFPPVVIYLIRMGEETGRLDRTLMDASDHLRRISRIAVDVKKALLYPSFALAATLFACGFWLEFTVPSLQELYLHMNVTLPTATQVVIDLSESLQENFLIYLLTPIIVVVLFRTLIKHHIQARYIFHKFIIKVPVVGKMIRFSNLAFIFEYFSLLLSSGVDIYRTLGLIENSLDNEVYKESIGNIKREVAKGESLATGILKQGIYPRFVSRMIKTGETSGTTDTQMKFIAAEYRDKLKDIIDRLKTLIEPVSIILIGGLMVVIIGALFFPIYQLIGSISSSGF